METSTVDKIIYQLTIEDLQNVANEELGRDLNQEEINLLEEKIGDHIDWYDAIHTAIFQNIKK